MTEQKYDVFLCHNSEDKHLVIQIAKQLKERGLKPWLDEWELKPGTVWQIALEHQIETISSAVVFVGQRGIGPWQREEILAFLQEFKSTERPVIPAILANARSQPKLPIFLRNRHWVDFRKENPDPLSQLIWGITGRKQPLNKTEKNKNDSNAREKASLSLSKKSEIRSSKIQYIELKPGNGLPALLKGKDNIQTRVSQIRFFVQEMGGGIELEMILIPKEDLLSVEGMRIESFFMSKYPITQAQWKAASCLPKIDITLSSLPSKFKGEKNPVESISWHEAIEFCKRLSFLSGISYRLPSESEWEYACRAGTTSKFHFGNSVSKKFANFLGDNDSCSGRSPTPVDFFPYPNSFGLYDMHGNVYEWCLDNWRNKPSLSTEPFDLQENLLTESIRVIRGGSWRDLSSGCHSSHRQRKKSISKEDFVGFRIVASDQL
ncbi:SUMF1/EgtB/PvdO family nonheme iron enzyme [Nodosilinea sp. E11]|uniref:SUMF1/EgtB/PvdO family nonheme iron enzyme n=1 Tax=Nodosilinea sp. E11 TaxID=3037479 RepID=UPI002934B61D|nr:SUMF1/EgtB/PvdO family nonheme iron enzyme [Nodosilinea sp. E11]WOD38174.1 SUMF1/EgtB/PvdO family nonheme iron enzyme [Nodosilinea sp. E11]